VLARLEAVADRQVLAILGVSILSLLGLVVVVASRLSSLPDVIPVHLDAAGTADRWAAPRVIWRLPLLAGMTTAINLILAWAVSASDRFAARFIMAAGLVVHLIVWVAIFDLV
jgi:hypothetical protein